MKLQIRVNLNAMNGLVLCSMGPPSAVVNDVIFRFDPFYILLMSTDTVVNQQVIPFEIHNLKFKLKGIPLWKPQGHFF